jgi:tetratricopeptide (TPR) repeat protein
MTSNPKQNAERQDDELWRRHQILRSDPQRFVELYGDDIRQDPGNAAAYFARHHGWLHLQRLDHAMADLNTAIVLKPNYIKYLSRGELFRRLGDHPRAIADFDQAEALDRQGFIEAWGPLYRADSHARLGNEAAALADCARLADDHWTPGLNDAPGGNKEQVIAEIRRRAALARAATRR